MQEVGHEASEKGFEDVGLVHGGVAMGTQEAELDIMNGTDHGGLGEGDCMFDGWLGIAATFDCVGEDGG